jgi:hypothetical protein
MIQRNSESSETFNFERICYVTHQQVIQSVKRKPAHGTEEVSRESADNGAFTAVKIWILALACSAAQTCGYIYTLKIEATRLSETSVITYNASRHHYTQSNGSSVRRSKLFCSLE